MDPPNSWQIQSQPHLGLDNTFDNGCTNEPDVFGHFNLSVGGYIDAPLDLSYVVSNSYNDQESSIPGFGRPETSFATWADHISSPRSIASAQSWCHDREYPVYPRPKLSTSSCETDSSLEEEDQRPACSTPGCNQRFDNIQSLEYHTKNTLHKAWKCAEPNCRKMYARRDTFLRHRATHRDNSHACVLCRHENKQKVFKRKDHLKEHIRNCHMKGIGAQSSDAVRWMNAHTQELVNESRSKSGLVEIPVKDEGCTQQQLAMKDLVKSLRTVLGDRDPNFMGELGEKMTSLSGPDMETVAASMANAALKKTFPSSGRKCGCACGRFEN